MSHSYPAEENKAPSSNFFYTPHCESDLDTNGHHHRCLLESIPHIAWTASSDGALTYINQEWVEQTGLPVSESLGFGFIKAIHPNDQGVFLDSWNQALNCQQSYEAELRLQHSNGHYRWFAIRVNPILGAQGQVSEWIGTLTSIGGRKQAEMKLRAEQEFLRAVLVNLSDGIVACDADGIIMMFNPTAREFHGIPEEPIPPEEWAQQYGLYLPDGKTIMPTEHIPLFRALRGEHVHDTEMVIQSQDGDLRTVLASGDVIIGPEGECLGAVVAMHDITRRKQVEAEIQALNVDLEARVYERTLALEKSHQKLEREIAARRRVEEQLEFQNKLLTRQNHKLEQQRQRIQRQNLQLIEASRLKSQFLATMSHELRTPMHAIIGFSQLLLRQRKSPLPPQISNMVERILNNGKRLLMLVDEVLDFSKIEAGHLELKPQRCNVADVVTATIDELRSLAHQKHLKLRLNMNLENAFLVNDPMRVRQVLVNLISNAIKFTDNGYVQVDVSEIGPNRLAIAVQDTGIGIRPSEIKSIFEPFRQVDQTNTRKHEGTGLGLAITDSLVQMMQGEITVSSQVGAGTIFRVEIPRNVIRKDLNRSSDSSYQGA
ncbi:MAG TPA: PAS domain-containing sensor histidine kinase [Elainellaceae cyanobacterium]